MEINNQIEVSKEKLFNIISQGQNVDLSNEGLEETISFNDFRIEILQILKHDQHRATEGMASYVKSKYKFKSIRNDDKKEIWIYLDGIYVQNGASYIEQQVRRILGQAYTTYVANQVIAKIYTDSFIEHEDFFNNNNNKYLLPVENGILNLKTRELKDFSPNLYFFTKLNIKYNPNALCPLIIKFIQSITQKESDIDVIQEMFGFCLIKDYKYEKAFMLYGERGRNGKSKLLELLKLLLNPKNVCGLSLENIEKDDFSLSQLHGKLANIGGDISNYNMKDTSKFKSLTGRDMIDANRKFKTRLHFENYAKMIFACNNLPVPQDDSDAFWLRWVFIEFPYQFLPQKEIDGYSGDKSHVRLQDAEIIKKLSDKSELEGLLVWALDGLDRLENQKDFSDKDTSETLKKKWQRRSNSVAAFIDDEIEYEYDNKISKADFRQKYNDYCTQHRIKKLSDTVIKITLQNKLGISGDYIYDGQKKIYIWENVRFKDKLSNFEQLMQNKYNMYENAEIKEDKLYELFIENGATEDFAIDKVNELLTKGIIMKINLNTYKVL